jgi:hypothetical protein
MGVVYEKAAQPTSGSWIDKWLDLDSHMASRIGKGIFI